MYRKLIDNSTKFGLLFELLVDRYLVLGNRGTLTLKKYRISHVASTRVKYSSAKLSNTVMQV